MGACLGVEGKKGPKVFLDRISSYRFSARRKALPYLALTYTPSLTRGTLSVLGCGEIGNLQDGKSKWCMIVILSLPAVAACLPVAGLRVTGKG